MPIEVDVDARLQEIAAATLAVVREHGAQGVTIRSVAHALGGSTTKVTNYIPSRSALLVNAIRHALDSWDSEADDILTDVPPAQRLGSLAAWMVSTDDVDPVLRQLLLELLGRSTGNEEALSAMREDVADEMDRLREEAALAGAQDPAFVADVLHLVTRGFYLCTLESPDVWTSEQAVPLVERLVAMLLAHAGEALHPATAGEIG